MDQSQSLNAPPYFDDEFHRISHISISKEAWQILEATYKGTKKVKDTELQMLTTHFEELKMSKDESFDSFYSNLNEVVIGKFNLGEKMEDSKVVRKILRSLSEVEAHDSSNEGVVDKDVVYLVKNFRKFLKFNNNGKFGGKGKFQNSGKKKKEFKRKDGKESQSTQGIICFECNRHKHFKKECPNCLKSKRKAYAITFSDSDSSNSDSEESCDGEGNYSTFMTIAHVKSSKDLNLLVQELGEHSDEESMGIVEESDVEEDESTRGLQENFNSLLEKLREYARMAKTAMKKMKKAEEDYRSLLVRHKEAKCEIETSNGELTETYSKIKFLELEVVQANAKFSNKSGLGYTGKSSSTVKITKEVKFVQANEPVVVASTLKIVGDEKRKNMADQRVLNKPRNQSIIKLEAKGKSLPRSQRGPRTNHFCHHCGLQGHTKSNCHKLRALKNATNQRSRGPRNDKRTWAVESSRGRNGDLGVIDVTKMTSAFTTCLESFNRRFENSNSCTQSYRDITPNAHDVWVKRDTYA
ncbi:uncharacterized protein LOC136067753 [Quercus suber]|uniref:uncharacterized protein LOC136067753 n=1 Tax=Quercus suber TaxID=58331 RepID=UPI0032E00E4B